MPSFSRISRRPVPIRPLVLACALLSCLALDACKTTELHPASDGGPPNRWIGYARLRFTATSTSCS